MTGPPRNPRAGRQRFLLTSLRIALLLTGACAVAAIVLDGDAGDTAAGLMVGLLVAVPVMRIGWLLLRWSRLGDWPFAAAAAGLLAVMAAGAALAG